MRGRISVKCFATAMQRLAITLPAIELKIEAIMGKVRLFCALALGLATCLSANPSRAQDGSLMVYIGTYTRKESRGIYRGRLDLTSGRLHRLELAAEIENPSFVAIHPSRTALYAVNEISQFDGKPSGAITAFSLGDQGELKFLNQQASGGRGPCHLIVDKTGKHVLVANYGGGSVAALPIDEAGRLGPASSFHQHQGSSANVRRQSAPHAHCIRLDGSNRFAVAADLGLDKLLVYRFDARQGDLKPHATPSASVAPGAGPRHFTFHPNNRFAYVINELNSTITAFSFDVSRGTLEEIQTITTVPDGYKETNYTAEIRVTPNGRYLYGSNRGHDSLAMFAVNESTGKLRPLGHQSTGGQTPRNFRIDPTGKFVLAANQNTDNVVVLAIQPDGTLKATGHEAKVSMPVCIKMIRPGG